MRIDRNLFSPVIGIADGEHVLENINGNVWIDN